MERSGPGFLNKEYVEKLEKSCEAMMWEYVSVVADCLVLITGMPANGALLWLILGEKKSLSAAKMIGVNLVVMDFFYMSLLPFSLIFHKDTEASRNNSASSEASDPLEDARDVFDMFSLVGCTLLLTCMCVERYLAVMRPVLYLRLRRWDYKAVVCIAVWAVTFAFVGAAAKWANPSVMSTAVSVVISFLFVVMLGCLGTIMRSLRQRGPARPESPQKRQAAMNVLAVVVPAVSAYLPVLLMFMVVIHFFVMSLQTDRVLCSLYELSRLSPRLGVLIGPLFYLSRAKQMCCLSGT